VYLGVPGSDQRCPAAATGRTEAILVSPLGARTEAMLPRTTTRGAAARAGTRDETQLAIDSHHLLVTATWDRHPAVIRRALGLRSLGATARRPRRPSEVAYARARARAFARSADGRMRSFARGRATTPPATPAAPGQVFTGGGFDACKTPSQSQMTAWGASPYRAIGVYIGGTNMACSQPNLTPTWVAQQSAAGWHLIPIYVGLQAPTNSCGCRAMSGVTATASSQGVAAAQDAVIDAQAIGLGAGNPLYLDMEGYNTTSANTAAVLAFVSGWTDQLHAEGYLSGVYSSSDSGIADLASQYGTGYAEPDEIWIANWNGQSLSTADPNAPPADWASHQRLHQYEGAHDERYGGVRINIDGDYVDAATAAAGTGPGVAPTPAPAPALGATPGPSGSVALTPSWPYQSGVATWQVVAGPSQSSLSWVGPAVPAGGSLPIVTTNDFRYYAVQALGSAGQLLGTSAPVADPARLAVFGGSAFVPAHGVAGVPVACFAVSPCVVQMTLRAGRTAVARTGPERIRGGGGLAYFKLTPRGRRMFHRTGKHGLPVDVRVRDLFGDTVTRQLRLKPFFTISPRPRRSARQSPALHFIGLTDFVSHGWVGGILARCTAGAPCQVTTRLSYGHRTIARQRTGSLGAGELGYLFFSLTRGGHRLLSRAPGNQLPVRATLTTTTPAGTASATARIVLIAFR
ncbi:MAG: DUF1906 domain-containing protein, partial [Solirubrobacteraceae bacterium]